MKTVCRFIFPEGTDLVLIESHIAQAITTAEAIFGQARVRISAEYCLSMEKNGVVLDVSTEVGESIASIFTGLIIKDLGENGFTVERVNK